MTSSQAERVRAQIEDEILSLKIKPGERMDETRLAERYGTSRTPVREALRQLSANGLVEIIPHKGAAVIKLGPRDLIELFEVLAELEGACAKFAARSCLRSDLETMQGIIAASKQHVESGDVLAYYKADLQFHRAIYQASHNNSLIKMTAGLHNRVAPYRRLELEQVNRMQTSYEQHMRIAEAIAAGDAVQAAHLARLHVSNNGLDGGRLIAMLTDGAEEYLVGMDQNGEFSGARGAGRANGQVYPAE
jgi:DNA-binding GntR family transcriptional regulator